MSSSKLVADIFPTQLYNVLPKGTFLVFQILAPLATNAGRCGKGEIVLTSCTLIVLCALCCASCFTDSFKGENEVVYYGFVTRRGLWNPNFRHAPIKGTEGSFYVGGGEKYQLELGDFVHAGLSVVALATISLLTDPVTPCFHPPIPPSLRKTVPLLVGLVVGAVCGFATKPRNGIGFAGTARHQPASSMPEP